MNSSILASKVSIFFINNMDSLSLTVTQHLFVFRLIIKQYKSCQLQKNSLNKSLTQSYVGFHEVSLHYKLKPNKSWYPESQSECVSVSHDLWMFTFLIPLPLVEHWGHLRPLWILPFFSLVAGVVRPLQLCSLLCKSYHVLSWTAISWSWRIKQWNWWSPRKSLEQWIASMAIVSLQLGLPKIRTPSSFVFTLLSCYSRSVTSSLVASRQCQHSRQVLIEEKVNIHEINSSSK